MMKLREPRQRLLGASFDLFRLSVRECGIRELAVPQNLRGHISRSKARCGGHEGGRSNLRSRRLCAREWHSANQSFSCRMNQSLGRAQGHVLSPASAAVPAPRSWPCSLLCAASALQSEGCSQLLPLAGPPTRPSVSGSSNRAHQVQAQVLKQPLVQPQPRELGGPRLCYALEAADGHLRSRGNWHPAAWCGHAIRGTARD